VGADDDAAGRGQRMHAAATRSERLARDLDDLLRVTEPARVPAASTIARVGVSARGHAAARAACDGADLPTIDSAICSGVSAPLESIGECSRGSSPRPSLGELCAFASARRVDVAHEASARRARRLRPTW
jgi:hypothetical protein